MVLCVQVPWPGFGNVFGLSVRIIPTSTHAYTWHARDGGAARGLIFIANRWWGRGQGYTAPSPSPPCAMSSGTGSMAAAQVPLGGQ